MVLLALGLFVFFVLNHFRHLYSAYFKYFLMWGWFMVCGLFLGQKRESAIPESQESEKYGHLADHSSFDAPKPA